MLWKGRVKHLSDWPRRKNAGFEPSRVTVVVRGNKYQLRNRFWHNTGALHWANASLFTPHFLCLLRQRGSFAFAVFPQVFRLFRYLGTVTWENNASSCFVCAMVVRWLTEKQSEVYREPICTWMVSFRYSHYELRIDFRMTSRIKKHCLLPVKVKAQIIYSLWQVWDWICGYIFKLKESVLGVHMDYMVTLALPLLLEYFLYQGWYVDKDGAL